MDPNFDKEYLEKEKIRKQQELELANLNKKNKGKLTDDQINTNLKNPKISAGSEKESLKGPKSHSSISRKKDEQSQINPLAAAVKDNKSDKSHVTKKTS